MTCRQHRPAARQVVGLILLAALQRRRRGIHISTMLRPDQVPTGATLRELRAARGTSLDLTSHLEVRAEGRSSTLVWRSVSTCAVSGRKVVQVAVCRQPGTWLSQLGMPEERAQSDHALPSHQIQGLDHRQTRSHADSCAVRSAWLHADLPSTGCVWHMSEGIL